MAWYNLLTDCFAVNSQDWSGTHCSSSKLDIGNRLALFLTVAQNRSDSFLAFGYCNLERVCIQFDSCISKLQQRLMLNSSSFDG